MIPQVCLVLPYVNTSVGQLSKMGILPGAKSDSKAPTGKRRSTLDFSGLGPLKTSGTVGFSAFRDQEAERAKKRGTRKKNHGAMDDSDDDDSDAGPLAKMEDSDDKVIKAHLEPEDAKVTGELQAGIDRIRVRFLDTELNPLHVY